MFRLLPVLWVPLTTGGGGGLSRSLSLLGGCVATAVLAALLVVASPSLVGAASITVGGSCSLADAITAANTDAASGGCAAGSGADVITLAGDVTLAADLPAIISDVTINGGGHSIDGAGARRVFRITVPRVTVRFNNLRLANGRITGAGGAIQLQVPTSGPGGTMVALNGVIVESNYASTGGGGLDCGREANAPTDNNADTLERIEVSIDNSVFKNNEGHRGAGAVRIVWGCTVTVNRSAFYGNSVTLAGWTGGAFEMLGRSRNGVRHEAALNITNSTIFGNRAPAGGALQIGAASTVRLKHVTITDNTSTNTSNSGSAIYLTSNHTDSRELRLHVENSIIYGNNGRYDCRQARALKTNSGNMIGTGNCGAGTNPVSGDPKLTAEPSSGAIPFYGLRPGSPAIDAVACLSGVNVDQIGEPRPHPSSASSATPCDVGAIEVKPAPSIVLLRADGPLVEGGGPVTITATFDNPTRDDGGLHLNLGGTATFGGSQKETNALNAGALALLRRVAPNHRLLNLPPPAGSDYWTPQQGISKHTSSSSVQGVGEIAVPAGSRTASFEITVLPDAVTDPNETITIDAMLRGPDDPPNCVQGEGGTVCTVWAGRFYGEPAETLTLTIADRPATAGEQQNSPPPQNQQPQPQPQIPQPANPQPQLADPQPQSADPQPEPNPSPQPQLADPQPQSADPGPQPQPDPQPQQGVPEPQPVPQAQQGVPDPQPQQQVQEVELPHAVTDLVLTATAKTVTASWQAPTTSAVVDKYIVQLKAPRGEKGKNRRVDGTKTTTTFRNLTPGVTYKIKVRALNDAGKSQRVTATVTTPQTQ